MHIEVHVLTLTNAWKSIGDYSEETLQEHLNQRVTTRGQTLVPCPSSPFDTRNPVNCLSVALKIAARRFSVRRTPIRRTS